MVRLLREVDGRLTDHVLNFYIVADDETYVDEVSTLSRNIRRDLERKVSKFGYLIAQQQSRMFVLRAIIASRILRTIFQETQASAPGDKGNFYSKSFLSCKGIN